MIFISRNERGVLKADWIAGLHIGVHYVTRRPKGREVGKEDAVCPGRGKFAVARGKCVSSMTHPSWVVDTRAEIGRWCKGNGFKAETDWGLAQKLEAHKEGFDTVDGWLNWYTENKIDIDKLYRNEYVKVK